MELFALDMEPFALCMELCPLEKDPVLIDDPEMPVVPAVEAGVETEAELAVVQGDGSGSPWKISSRFIPVPACNNSESKFDS